MKENIIENINIADNDIDSRQFATLNWVVRVGERIITPPDCGEEPEFLPEMIKEIEIEGGEWSTKIQPPEGWVITSIEIDVEADAEWDGLPRLDGQGLSGVLYGTVTVKYRRWEDR